VRAQALTLVLALLKAEEESISIRDLSERLTLPQEDLLKLFTQLEEEKVIKKTNDDAAIIVPRGEDRLRTAIKAVTLGARIEESAKILSWKEFESFCTKVMEENGYSCIHEFRFKSSRGRRYECDIVALCNPMLLLADCKHYAGKVRGLRTVVEKQVERANALDKSFLTLMRGISQLASWQEIIIVPIIITLFPESIAFVDGVPVIPAFKLNQFIQELPSNMESVKHIDTTPSKQRRLV
jgi:hypothetical protein